MSHSVLCQVLAKRGNLAEAESHCQCAGRSEAEPVADSGGAGGARLEEARPGVKRAGRVSAAEAHAEAVIDVDVACVAMKKTRTASSWLRFQCYRQPTSDLFWSTKSRPPCAVDRACCAPCLLPASCFTCNSCLL